MPVAGSVTRYRPVDAPATGSENLPSIVSIVESGQEATGGTNRVTRDGTDRIRDGPPVPGEGIAGDGVESDGGQGARVGSERRDRRRNSAGRRGGIGARPHRAAG